MRFYTVVFGVLLVVVGLSAWQFGTRSVDVQVERIETNSVSEWMKSTVADRVIKEVPLDVGVTVSARCSVLIPIVNDRSDIRVYVMDPRNYELWSKGSRDLQFATLMHGQGDFNFTFTSRSAGTYRVLFDNSDSPYKKAVSCSADYAKVAMVTEKRFDRTLNQIGIAAALLGAVIAGYGAVVRQPIPWK